MAEIEVDHAEGDSYDVTVREEGGASRHRVTVTDADHVRFGPGASKEELLEESFRFLLEREPRESILEEFELPVIARYFPDYPSQIQERLE